MPWVVKYERGLTEMFADMPPAAARRAMQLIREFAANPSAVEFEIVWSYYLFLHAEKLPGWRVLVVLSDPVVWVLRVTRYDATAS